MNRNCLKCYREEVGLSQVALAELVGVRRETIMRLESGSYSSTISLLTALKLKKVLHCPLAVLLSSSQLEEIKNI